MRHESEADRYWREVDNCIRLASLALSEGARRQWRELAVRYTDLALEATGVERRQVLRLA